MRINIAGVFMVSLQLLSIVTANELEALLAFYSGTDGPQWIRQDFWNTDTTYCNWYGISCKEDASGFKYVSAIQLPQNGLSSTRLPEQLCDLTGLQILDLSSNLITNHIPECIGRLSQLSELYLNNNQISGSPDALGDLTSLKILNLSSNSFETSIPDSWANLKSLEELYLDYNKFETLNADNMISLTNLNKFYIRNNRMQGALSDEMGQLPFAQRKPMGCDFSGNDLICPPSKWARGCGMECF